MRETNHQGIEVSWQLFKNIYNNSVFYIILCVRRAKVYVLDGVVIL